MALQIESYELEVRHESLNEEAPRNSSKPVLPLPNLDEMPLPEREWAPDGRSVIKYFRYRFFTIYQRLFTFIFALNLAIFAWMLTEHTEPTLENVVLLSNPIAFNLFLSILFRTEDFINLLYLSIIWIPVSLPLTLRRALAKIYQFGGVHSGAGAACTAWALIFAIQATRTYHAGNGITVGVIVVTFVIFTLLLFIVVTAHPTIRRLQHNTFEAIHRFCGWGSLLLFWSLTMVLGQDVAEQEGSTLAESLFCSSAIYFLIFTTALLILPWLRLRRITLNAVTPSNHLTRLYFPWPNAKPTQTVRLSSSPLMEWHSFAIIPPSTISPTGTDPSSFSCSFTVLVSSAGDWTKSIIATESQTRNLWIRGIPTTGVTIVAKLFRSVVVVATGSGIGPILSLVAAAQDPTSKNITQSHLIWSTQAPEQTYGEQVMQEVYGADPNAIIWDTKKKGRPDLVALAWRLYKQVDAEAVIVVSNQNVTKRTVFGLESMGVPAFGPIFDS